MKTLTTCFYFFFSLTLFAQEKGVLPISTDGKDGSGNTYAVVVGISNYQDEGIPDLRFADKDAEAFARYLQSPAGGSLDKDHLKVLINEEATVAQFAIALDWLMEVVTENDRVLVYFSGHGDVERKTITQPGYLLCWDAPSRVYLAGGALALPMFQDIVTTLSAQNKAKIVVITDACRSGKLSGSAVGGAQITGSNLAQQYANEIKILSCQPEEYSIEGEQWGGGRGAFSYHLLDGLSGLADSNTDGQVSLKEIGRYLEDNVTEEVAPQSQNPMTIGNKVENLADVLPEFLAQVKERQKGQDQIFASTESRGIEEDVLAEADSNIVELYVAFKKALKEKNFLSPENASVPADKCAEVYYQILSVDAKLERLHSSMRRNYAAALQDDAQQVMNNWLKSDLNELVLSKVSRAAKYENYPQYLDRAAELLGEEHYMFPVLKARKLYFEGYLMHMDLFNPDESLGEKILDKYSASLLLLPNSPHTYFSMSKVHFYQMAAPDSAEYYTKLAMEFAPTWIEPYSTMGGMYFMGNYIRDTVRAKYFLELADDVDSSAGQSNILHLNKWGNYYRNTGQFDNAEKTFLKALAIDSTVCATSLNLGSMYFAQKKFPQAVKHTLDAIRIDSTQSFALSNLGITYLYMGRFAEAEEFLRKVIGIDSLNLKTLNGLCIVYLKTGRFEEAEPIMKKIIELDPTVPWAYNNMGTIYLNTGRLEQAEEQFLKSIQIDSTFWNAYASLGRMYYMGKEWEQALSMTQKAMEHGPELAGLYNQLGIIYTHLPGRLQETEAAFNKALDMEPSNPDIYLNHVKLSLIKNQSEKAMKYLEQGLKIGAETGYMNFKSLQENPDLEEMRKDPKWVDLMKKYFPDQYKD